jgi:hypothetical protein
MWWFGCDLDDDFELGACVVAVEEHAVDVGQIHALRPPTTRDLGRRSAVCICLNVMLCNAVVVLCGAVVMLCDAIPVLCDAMMMLWWCYVML